MALNFLHYVISYSMRPHLLKSDTLWSSSQYEFEKFHEANNEPYCLKIWASNAEIPSQARNTIDTDQFLTKALRKLHLLLKMNKNTTAAITSRTTSNQPTHTYLICDLSSGWWETTRLFAIITLRHSSFSLPFDCDMLSLNK